MSKSLSDIEKVVAVAEIQRFGDKLTLPEGMKLETAIDLLQRRAEYEEEETEFSESYDVFPFDGAHALNEVLIRMYGWAPATGTPLSSDVTQARAFSRPSLKCTPRLVTSAEVRTYIVRGVPWRSSSKALPSRGEAISTTWNPGDKEMPTTSKGRMRGA